MMMCADMSFKVTDYSDFQKYVPIVTEHYFDKRSKLKSYEEGCKTFPQGMRDLIGYV